MDASEVVIRPTRRQSSLWWISTVVLLGYAVVGYLVVGRFHAGLGLITAGFELVLTGCSLWAVPGDRRRGVALGDEGVVVTGWAGSRTLGYAEISHTEVFQRLGTSRLALHLADGSRVVLGAPRHGRLDADPRFAEKVAAVERELGRRTGTGPATDSWLGAV